MKALLSFVSLFLCMLNTVFSQETENNLSGKWYVVSVINDGVEEIETDCDRGQYFHLFPDGKLVAANATSTTSCNYKKLEGTFVQKGDTLAFALGKNKDNTLKLSILSQNEENLVLEGIENGAKFILSNKRISIPPYPALASGNVNDHQDLWGKWYYVSDIQNGKEKISIDCDRKQYLHFYPSGKIIVKNGYPTSCSYRLLVGEYERKGKNLKVSLMKYAGREMLFQIVSQDSKKLVLEAEMGENHVKQVLIRKSPPDDQNISSSE